MLPFLVIVTLTGWVRISKTRNCWKDLSLKLLLFINLYHASRGPLIFLDKSGRLKRSVVWREKTGTIIEPQTNRVSKHENWVLSFEKPAFFYTHHSKGFQEMIFYLEVWKIDSVFLYQVYLLNYHNCFYICEGLYLHAWHTTA